MDTLKGISVVELISVWTTPWVLNTTDLDSPLDKDR